MSDNAASDLAFAAALFALFALIAVMVWAHRPRPTQLVAHHTHEPAVDVQKLVDTIGRLAAVKAIHDYRRQHHSYDVTTGRCGCGDQHPCPERGRLNEYTATLTREDVAR